MDRRALYLLVVTFLCDISLGFIKIVDLTWDFDNETIYWSDMEPYVITKTIRQENSSYWYAANDFCAGEHGGTHFDAPYHFNKEGWKVADVPVERMIGRGALIDLSNTEQNLEVEHLENFARRYGPFKNNTILFVKFGWSARYPNRTLYLGEGLQGDFHFPGISAEAAEWIGQSKRIVGIGVDTASLDPGNNVTAHQVLEKYQIFGIENLKLLEYLPPNGFTVVALPMKLRYGTGAPVRVLAIPNDIVYEIFDLEKI